MGCAVWIAYISIHDKRIPFNDFCLTYLATLQRLQVLELQMSRSLWNQRNSSIVWLLCGSMASAAGSASNLPTELDQIYAFELCRETWPEHLMKWHNN